MKAADDMLGADAIPAAALPATYREAAAQLRALADTAETVEMRTALLSVAERFDRLADSLRPASWPRRQG